MQNSKKQFLRNTVTGWLAQVVGAAIGFTLLPLNISYLGNEAYGISVLAVSALAMLNMLDLGMAPAVLRFFSQAIAKDDSESLKKLVSTSLFLMGGLGLLGFTLILLFSATFISFYKISAELMQPTYYLLACMAVSFLLSFVSMVFNGLLLANSRYDLVNYLTIASQLLRLVLLLLFYSLVTPSLLLLGLAIVIASAFNLIALLVMSRRENGDACRFSMSQVDKKVLLPMFSFSSLAFINSLFFAASTQVPVMIIGRTLGLDMVTAFVPAVTVSIYLATALGQISSPLVPLASRDMCNNEGNNMGRWATLLGQLVSCIGYAFILILIVFGTDIQILWLGKEMAWTAVPVMILATGVVFGSIQSVNYSLAIGSSNIAPVAYSSVWMAVVSSLAILVGTLYWKWHLIEVATCMTVVRFIRNGYYLPFVFSRTFNYRFGSYFAKVYLKPAIALLPLLLLGLAGKGYLGEVSPPVLLAHGLAVIASYMALCWFLVIENESKREIRSNLFNRSGAVSG